MAVQWWERVTFWAQFKQLPPHERVVLDDLNLRKWQEFYPVLVKQYTKQKNVSAASELALEARWIAEGKPYYLLYPSIIEPFLRLDLGKVDTGHLKLPTDDTLLIQLPTTANVWEGGLELRNIMLGKSAEGIQAVIDYCKIGAGWQRTRQPGAETDCFTAGITISLQSGRTLKNTLDDGLREPWLGKPDRQPPNAMVYMASKIIAVCLLLEQDPQIISPEVLSSDLRKWQETLDPKYVHKARRRGKYGWVVGRDIEVLPHYRRPHPALFWTGQGREIPIVKMRAGSIVHREIITEVPTGYQDEK